MSFYRTPFSFLEPLESRIAPAQVYLVGVPNTGQNAAGNLDIDYNDINPSQEPILLPTVGDLLVGSVGGDATTFYMRMSAGDVLEIYNGTNGGDEVFRVSAGKALVFFRDINGNNEVDHEEITGISLGANASVALKDSMSGSVVTNLNENGTADPADDTFSMTSLVGSKQGIKLLDFGGSVGGDIIAGGNITNVSVLGSVNAILVGSAADGGSFDFFPGIVGGEGAISYTEGVGIIGGSITNIRVDDVVDRIEAGGGGEGAAGGSISKVVINEDNTGFTIQAGDGGSFGLTKTAGGKGGSVSAIYITGFAGLPNPGPTNDNITIIAGSGGISGAAKGGDGGTLSNIFVGFDLINGKTFPSASISTDNVALIGGAGGSGKTGGKGGSLSAITVNVAVADDISGLDEIQAIAGDGGAATVATGGKAGVGGSISNVVLRNQTLVDFDADILVQAGDGGTAVAGLATGALGGSISNSTFQGFNIVVLAGDGSDAKVGGAGGSLTKLVIDPGDGVVTRTAVFEAGIGGDGSNGNGGKGGAITTLTLTNGDFSTMTVNAAGGGDGGVSTIGGKGGAGGAVTGVNIFDGDVTSGLQTGTFIMRTGDGGNGEKGGGVGGALTKSGFIGLNMHAIVTTGNGGNATGFSASAKGGAGGLMSEMQISLLGSIGGFGVDGTITTGLGGNGAGPAGAGGAGGEMKFVDLSASRDVILSAGNGGNGSGAAPGKGGSIYVSQGFGSTGTGVLMAGDGGAVGTRAAAGGSITGKSPDLVSGMFSMLTLTVSAGDGTNGGAGGSLKYVGYASTSPTLTPSPDGIISITAGNGSASPDGKYVGVGGSIDTVAGSVSSSIDPLQSITMIIAGNGGGSALKSAKGGSITNLDISRGGMEDILEIIPNGTIIIAAGDAGDTTGTAAGAAGGSVKGVSISDILIGTDLRSIAAGDGGNSANKGGLGGSLTDIRVLDKDIGIRSGATFGYATMGGLFAGAGGTGTTAGKAGNVSQINAQAIAAIVAGKDVKPQLVEKVSYIYVGNTTGFVSTDLLKVSDLDLDLSEVAGDADYRAYVAGSFASNNLVGAVLDPTLVDGNKFHFTDTNANGVFDIGEDAIDGLVAAKVFDQKTANFTPEFYRGDGTFVATETVVGGPGVAEVQTLEINAPKFILSYGNSETPLLTTKSNAASMVTYVGTSLNKLQSIIDAGGVTVTTGGINTYVVTFNLTGARTMISSNIVFDFDNVY